MSGKKWYFKEIFKSFTTIVTSLFFACALVTLLVATQEFSVLKRLQSLSSINFILVATLIFVCMVGFGFILGIKDKALTIADAVYFAMAISGVGFLSYLTATVKSVSQIESAVCLSLILFGGVLMIVRSYYFNGDQTKTYRSNILKDYFGTIKDIYSVLGVALIAIVTVAVGYLIINTDFFSLIYNDKKLLVIIGVLLIPSVIFVIMSMVKKRVGLFDATLISGFISMPILVVDVALLSFPETKTIAVLSVALCWLVLCFIKFSSFNLLPKPYTIRNNKFANYYGRISYKHGILKALAIAGIIAICAIIALKTSAVKSYILNFPSGDLLITSAISVILITAATPIILGILSSLFSLGLKKVSTADFLLLTCFFSAIFGGGVYYLFPSNYCLYVVASLGGYSIIASIIRICSTKR